jgi:hypothetical protein
LTQKKFKTLLRFITDHYNKNDVKNHKDEVQRKGQSGLGLLTAYMTGALYCSNWLKGNDHVKHILCCHITFNCVLSQEIYVPIKIYERTISSQWHQGRVWCSPQAQISIPQSHVTFNINCFSTKIPSQYVHQPIIWKRQQARIYMPLVYLQGLESTGDLLHDMGTKDLYRAPSFITITQSAKL